MELYQLCFTIIFALSPFDSQQFGTARWSPSAFTKSSTGHENDNISIQASLVIARMSRGIDPDCVIDEARSSFGHDLSGPSRCMEQCTIYHILGRNASRSTYRRKGLSPICL